MLEDPKQQPTVNTETSSREALIVRDFCDKITYAFQLATGQGPLCQEPMQGTAVFLEEIAVNASEEELDLGRLTGEAIRLVRESISQGFLDWSPRIMLAMYSCEIQASSTHPLYQPYPTQVTRVYTDSKQLKYSAVFTV